jgi:hypothetical protein
LTRCINCPTYVSSAVADVALPEAARRDAPVPLIAAVRRLPDGTGDLAHSFAPLLDPA